MEYRTELFTDSDCSKQMEGRPDLFPGDYYRFMDVDDPDLKLILDAFQIKIPPDLYRKADLRAIKASTKIFI